MEWRIHRVSFTFASKIYYVNCRGTVTTKPAAPSIPDIGPYDGLGSWITSERAFISSLHASQFGDPNIGIEPTRIIITTVNPVRTGSLDLLNSILPAATPISPPSQYNQHSTSTTVETNKLIIGLAVAITVLVLLVSIGLASFYIVRKRRRRKREALTAHQDVNDTKGERHTPPMYLQQKVELDDEQRRHEMEATYTRHELEGADKIHEMPAGERGSCGRPKLSGGDRSKGLQKPS